MVLVSTSCDTALEFLQQCSKRVEIESQKLRSFPNVWNVKRTEMGRWFCPIISEWLKKVVLGVKIFEKYKKLDNENHFKPGIEIKVYDNV